MVKGQLVGYARVSTSEQKLDIQLDAFKKIGVDKIYSEKISGDSKNGRTELYKCLDYMREGDSLVITKMDRLARSARDLYNIVYDLEEKGIALTVIDQGVDTRTAAGRAFMGMLATFAEFETSIRRERQLEGIAKAKAAGKYKGRKPTARAKKPQMIELLNKGVSKPQIAKQLGLSIGSVYTLLKDVTIIGDESSEK